MVAKFEQDRGHKLGVKRTQKKNFKKGNSTINHPSANEGANLSKVGESIQRNQQKLKQKGVRVLMSLVGGKKVKDQWDKEMVGKCKVMATNRHGLEKLDSKFKKPPRLNQAKLG
jgi:hypothetical protein